MGHMYGFAECVDWGVRAGVGWGAGRGGGRWCLVGAQEFCGPG
jgi:hypothetical protein